MMAMAMVFMFTGFAFACDGGGNMCDDGYGDYQQPTQTVSLGGMSNFAGFGGGIFTGEEGGVDIQKSGYGMTEISLSAEGDTCGLDCEDAHFTFTGAAGEMVQVNTWAAGTLSDAPVQTINEGGTAVGLTFEFNFQSPQPEH